MQKSTIRVLLVDDFEPSRSWVRSKLKVQEHLHIVGEAFDGLEAVQKSPGIDTRLNSARYWSPESQWHPSRRPHTTRGSGREDTLLVSGARY